MKPKYPSFFSFLFFIPLLLPAFSIAQAKHDGNHCVAAKSPYRLAMDSGKVIYTRQCLTCHQADGLGILNINPPLNRKDVMGDKKKLIEIVIKGVATHQEIDGVTYQNVMTPNPGMKDQEIADVLTYIRNSFGNKGSAVKTSEVKAVRNKLNSVE
jgi:mono/diheme cytochrome c family protein